MTPARKSVCAPKRNTLRFGASGPPGGAAHPVKNIGREGFACADPEATAGFGAATTADIRREKDDRLETVAWISARSDDAARTQALADRPPLPPRSYPIARRSS